jgi:hypothetical protein
MAFPRSLVSLALLVTGACSQVPLEAAPTPIQILLRARIGGETEQRFAGPLVFAEADSLVMTDMRLGRRVTLRTGPNLFLEIYRGQRSSEEAVVKSAARSALFGGLVGLASGLLGAATSAALGGSVGGLENWVRAGTVTGVSSGVAAGALTGAREGEAVWESVTILQLRQQLCKCANPDPPKLDPAVRLFPEA